MCRVFEVRIDMECTPIEDNYGNLTSTYVFETEVSFTHSDVLKGYCLYQEVVRMAQQKMRVVISGSTDDVVSKRWLTARIVVKDVKDKIYAYFVPSKVEGMLELDAIAVTEDYMEDKYKSVITTIPYRYVINEKGELFDPFSDLEGSHFTAKASYILDALAYVSTKCYIPPERHGYNVTVDDLIAKVCRYPCDS